MLSRGQLATKVNKTELCAHEWSLRVEGAYVLNNSPFGGNVPVVVTEPRTAVNRLPDEIFRPKGRSECQCSGRPEGECLEQTMPGSHFGPPGAFQGSLDLHLPGREAASVETHRPAVQHTLDTHKAKSSACVLA